MRRLSAELGVALGATYHHVRNRHDLLVLVGRSLYREAATPVPDGPWQERVKTLNSQAAHLVGRHPGMAPFLVAHLEEVWPLELNTAMKAMLLEANLGEARANSLMLALFFYTIGMMSTGYPSTGLEAEFQVGMDMLIAGAEALQNRV
jgi:AcrR family transcriptional regulator